MAHFRYPLILVLCACLPQLGFSQRTAAGIALKDTRGPVYGRACGIAGVDPAPRTELEGLLSIGDSLGVIAMLFDKDLVFQVYGAEGVIRLERSGMRFPELILQRVDRLRRSGKKIPVCSGCSHWEETIKEALRDKLSYSGIR